MRSTNSRRQSIAVAVVLTMLALGSDQLSAKDKALPAPDWGVDAAKLVTPDSAKDASAILLFHEYLITVDEQNHAVERERTVLRILKPQGRGYAHCSIGYDVDEKLNYFRSWTIAPDGRQFQAAESDFADHGAYSSAVLQFTERIRIVNPPASDPGSVVICETEERLRPYMNEEEWDIQSTIPILNQALELALPPGGHFAQSWRRFDSIEPVEVAPNHLRWEIKGMPALNLENQHATPHWGALAARMSVKWGDAAVKGTENQWRVLGLWIDRLEEHRTDPTPDITEKTRQLVAGAPDFYTKLSRITEFLQDHIRYFVIESGIGGFQAHPAGDIFRNEYGDCKDKTTLLISMLRVIGVRSYYLHVDSRRGLIDPNEPSHIGNHMITAIELPPGENDPRLIARAKTVGGKEVLIFDPTDEVTPVGLIRSELQGGYGNLADGQDSQVLRMPVMPPEAEGEVRKGDFILSADGNLDGTLKEEFSGDEATGERMFIKRNSQKELRERLEKTFNNDLPGFTLKDFDFTAREQLDQPLSLEIHLTTSNYAHPSGPLLIFRPRIVGSHARIVPEVMEGKPRIYPIELGHPGRWHDSFDVVVPAGYIVDDIPDPVKIDLDFASFHASVSSKDGRLHYEAEYVVKDIEVPASKANDFRVLESAVLAYEKNSAVLKKQ
jgi:hypothetical protein